MLARPLAAPEAQKPASKVVWQTSLAFLSSKASSTPTDVVGDTGRKMPVSIPKTTPRCVPPYRESPEVRLGVEDEDPGLGSDHDLERPGGHLKQRGEGEGDRILPEAAPGTTDVADVDCQVRVEGEPVVQAAPDQAAETQAGTVGRRLAVLVRVHAEVGKREKNALQPRRPGGHRRPRVVPAEGLRRRVVVGGRRVAGWWRVGGRRRIAGRRGIGGRRRGRARRVAGLREAARLRPGRGG